LIFVEKLLLSINKNLSIVESANYEILKCRKTVKNIQLGSSSLTANSFEIQETQLPPEKLPINQKSEKLSQTKQIFV